MHLGPFVIRQAGQGYWALYPGGCLIPRYRRSTLTQTAIPGAYFLRQSLGNYSTTSSTRRGERTHSKQANLQFELQLIRGEHREMSKFRMLIWAVDHVVMRMHQIARHRIIHDAHVLRRGGPPHRHRMARLHVIIACCVPLI